MMLGLRLGRRLMAAVAVDDEQVVFYECRYVSSRRDTMERAMRDYFAKILDQLSPTRVCYYAPTTVGAATDLLTSLLVAEAAARNIPAVRIEKATLLASCGLPTGSKRRHVREMVEDLWPVLSEGQVDRQLVCAEALVSALIGDSELSFGIPPVTLTPPL